jgi:hypothetical protein
MDFYSAILSLILVSVVAGALSFLPKRRKWPREHHASYWSTTRRVHDE